MAIVFRSQEFPNIVEEADKKLERIKWCLKHGNVFRAQQVIDYLATDIEIIEEIMKERGFEVDHSTVQGGVVHYAPQQEQAFHKNKKRPGGRWRLDETYRVPGVQGSVVNYYFFPEYNQLIVLARQNSLP